MGRHVLLTGGTGFLGSNVLCRLLRRGVFVHALVRGRPGVAPRVRLERAVQVADPELRLDRYDCEVIEGDVTAPGCGVAAEAVARLRGVVEEIWHSAASVNFALDGGATAEETRSVNVDGTRNLLGLATEIGAPPVHHVSTAYVAGFFEGRFMEADHRRRGRIFKNVYEQSKLEGEHLVHAYPGPWSIYRPSIIVGDSRSGRTLTFTGYYRFFSGLNALRMHLERRLRSSNAAQRSPAIRVADGDRLLVPMVLPCGVTSTVNLVPVDWVAETMLRLAELAPASGTTFHITHPTPPTARWTIERSSRLLGIDGLRFVEPYVLPTLFRDTALVHGDEVMQTVQRGVIDRIAAYVSYICQEPQFDDSNVRSALDRAYVPPRAVTEDFLKTLLDYALDKGFRERAA